jgi:hypothetical protein
MMVQLTLRRKILITEHKIIMIILKVEQLVGARVLIEKKLFMQVPTMVSFMHSMHQMARSYGAISLQMF